MGRHLILAIEFAELEIELPRGQPCRLAVLTCPEIDRVPKEAQQKWTDLDKEGETSPATPVTLAWRSMAAR